MLHNPVQYLYTVYYAAYQLWNAFEHTIYVLLKYFAKSYNDLDCLTLANKHACFDPQW